jgi:hypothetical protein
MGEWKNDSTADGYLSNARVRGRLRCTLPKLPGVALVSELGIRAHVRDISVGRAVVQRRVLQERVVDEWGRDEGEGLGVTRVVNLR